MITELPKSPPATIILWSSHSVGMATKPGGRSFETEDEKNDLTRNIVDREVS